MVAGGDDLHQAIIEDLVGNDFDLAEGASGPGVSVLNGRYNWPVS